MSHLPAWQCSKCRHQLGEVIGGAVRVWAPAPLVGDDVAAVECPRCHEVNTWKRSAALVSTSAMMMTG